MPPPTPIFGAVEAGGTKFACAVGHGPGAGILARTQFATGSDPSRVLAQVAEWLRAQESAHGALAAIGVASFGPVDLDERSPTHGFITTTPKPGWRGTDVLGAFRRAFPGRPVGFDTDVNGAALGEWRWGAARDIDDFVYVTVGTGIGGGAMVRGQLVHGLVHPEMGHIPMPPIDGDAFPGACAIHGRCWEGLCAGPAIALRAGRPADELAADDPAWEFTMCAMGQALATLTLVLSPRRIVVGGSVRKAGRLGEAAFFRGVRAHLREALAGYVASPALRDPGIDGFVVPPELGDDAGVCGAFVLAEQAAGDARITYRP
ncbi:MAG: ROK family protein [Planctomycetota bacterium]